MWSLYTVHNCNEQNSVRKKTKHCCHLSVNSHDFVKIVAIWIVNRTETCMRALAARSPTATSIRSPAIALQRILNLNPYRHRKILSNSSCRSPPTQVAALSALLSWNRLTELQFPPDRQTPVQRSAARSASSCHRTHDSFAYDKKQSQNPSLHRVLSSVHGWATGLNCC